VLPAPVSTVRARPHTPQAMNITGKKYHHFPTAQATNIETAIAIAKYPADSPQSLLLLDGSAKSIPD